MRTLWHAWACPYCQRARIALAEKRLSYESREIDPGSKPPALLEVNPAGSVPVLVEDDHPIPESLVILEYLEDRYPDPPLLPRDPLGRSRVRLLHEALRAGLAPAIGRLARGGPEERAAAEEAARSALAALEPEMPEDGFYAGAFGDADIALAPFVLKLPEALDPSRLGLPRLAGWRERVLARRSVARETARR